MKYFDFCWISGDLLYVKQRHVWCCNREMLCLWKREMLCVWKTEVIRWFGDEVIR